MDFPWMAWNRCLFQVYYRIIAVFALAAQRKDQLKTRVCLQNNTDEDVGGSSDHDDSTTPDFRRWTLVNPTITAHVFTHVQPLLELPEQLSWWIPPLRLLRLASGQTRLPSLTSLSCSASDSIFHVGSGRESPANITGNTFCVPSVHF